VSVESIRHEEEKAQAAVVQAPLLRIVDLSKSFGPVEVLKNINLEVHAREVHAIIGENGAGKSTLMKLIAGNERLSSGAIYVDGDEVNLTNPVVAEALGIVLVHQEILLAPDLTVAQNIYLGRELSRGIFVDDQAMRAGARQILSELGSDIDVNATVGRLSIAQRQLVQIARVLLVPHRLVIFDEPTASLTPVETQALLKLIANLRQKGVGVLYISHRLPEVKEISDRVSVLRDGVLVGTHQTDDLQPADMARLMVGRDIAKFYPNHTHRQDLIPVLEVENVSVPPHVTQASFQLHEGEILGFAGLVGAGRSELMEGIVGLRKMRGGLVRHHGRHVHFGNRHMSARDSLRAGIVYLSEDRKGKGLLLQKDMGVNLTLAALADWVKLHGRVNRPLLTKPLLILIFVVRPRIFLPGSSLAAINKNCFWPRCCYLSLPLSLLTSQRAVLMSARKSRFIRLLFALRLRVNLSSLFHLKCRNCLAFATELSSCVRDISPVK